MTLVIIILVAIALIVIFAVASKNKRLKKNYDAIKNQYPDGVREWRIKKGMSEKDAYIIEAIKRLDLAAKERMRIVREQHKRLKELYPHGYSRFTRMHFNPPPKDFESMETIIAHLENEYQVAHEAEEAATRIKDASPNGFIIWSGTHPKASNDTIIENEEAIKQAQERYQIQHRAELERVRREEEERQRLYSLSTTLKPDASAIVSHLQQSGVTCFYHFTDRSNIESIRRNGGLYSWVYCDEHNITGKQGGSGQSQSLDVRHGLQDYVRLSFCDDHPMMYRLGMDGYNLVLLKIDIEVATFETTRFSTINATDNRQENGTTLQDLKRVDIRATQRHYIPREDEDFKPHQAEVLVKTFIPSRYILNLDAPILVPTPTPKRRVVSDHYYDNDDLPF